MSKEKTNKGGFKLPKYLKLNKGSMWFDTDGDNSSGVSLYATNINLIGRDTKLKKIKDENGKIDNVPIISEIPKDKFDNKNINDFGKEDGNLQWYVDTTKIPSEKLSRILFAYKHGILVEADPKVLPKPITINTENDFTFNKDNGERIFNGKNKEIYVKLQNYNWITLKSFINSTPKNESGRQNLLDLFEYEKKGYNPLNRPRLEVLDAIRAKLETLVQAYLGLELTKKIKNGFKVINHTPSINQTGVFRNETISIYFDRPIQASTITWDTVTVQEKSSFTTMPGTLGSTWTSSGTCVQIDFVPELNMLSNTEYSVYVFGTPNSIVAIDGTLIDDTYVFNFTTGTGYYDSSGLAGVPSGYDVSGYETELSGINAIDQEDISSFYIYSTYPQNQQPNIELILSGVQIVFTGQIASSAQEITNRITIEEEDVL